MRDIIDKKVLIEYTCARLNNRETLPKSTFSTIVNALMVEKQFIEMRGSVEEPLPGGKFRIKLENDQEIIGYIAGRLRKFRIRIMPGDDVKVEISPYDLTKGRITYRF